ncbi:uncharacterized protein V6R79_012922 [Siganus canaliculatus]
MSGNTLSAVIEQQVSRLRLNDFPCGNGSWRKAKDGTDRADREEADALLDLLRCPHSPWTSDESWSPQAPALRRLAVLAPKRLRANFIYSYFVTLRIVDKSVSIIDRGLLKFSRLEELVLSANRISKVPAENLPRTLKILELRANQLSALNHLTSCPPPPLQYLGLASNSLGSHDTSHLTGRHWPHLVCLDLDDCEFEDQQTLLDALSTLPCLRTLVLEGNPFTLASSYPGVTVDSLPQLSCLDTSSVSTEDRLSFRGLAKMRDLKVGQASATVTVGRMRGIPDLLMCVDENIPDYPVVTYSYVITYEFPSLQTPVAMKFENKSESPATSASHVTENSCSDGDLQSNKKEDEQTSRPDSCVLMVQAEDAGVCRHKVAHVSRHSTLKLRWSDSMNFEDTQTHVVSDLGGFKRFLKQGLSLRIEEEKILSWPAVSKDVTVAKPSAAEKDKQERKRKKSAVKPDSTKDESKSRIKKSVPELVQDAPIRRILGSTHVPLQSLLRGQKVEVLCDFGILHTEYEDVVKKIMDNRRELDKESKVKEHSGKRKGKKECEVHVLADSSVSVQLEPVTVELRVELEKWKSASDAHQRLLPQHDTASSTKPSASSSARTSI